MLKKAFTPESFDFGMPAVEIIGYGSKGLDKKAMLKRASVFTDEDLEFPRKKGYQYLHVITTGGMEKYGSNANNDCFNYDVMTVEFPLAKTASQRFATLDGGLKKYHNKSYMNKKAGVYREHNTKEEPSGYIVKAATNDDMWRGELIIGIDEDKWRDELQKKASGKDIFLSMGCQVDHDTCTACHNQAHKASEYCEHIKKSAGKMLPDGTRIGMINDRPEFYDISIVKVPADKIAFTLKVIKDDPSMAKAASLSNVLNTQRPATLMTKCAVTHKKQAAEKLAKITKEIICHVDDDITEACKGSDEAEEELLNKLHGYSFEDVMPALSHSGILLSPAGFLKLVMGDDDSLKDVESEDIDMDNAFEELSENDEALEDTAYDSQDIPDIGIMNMISDLIPALSVEDGPVEARIIKVTIKPKQKKENKRESTLTKEASKALGIEYAKYVSSFLEQSPKDVSVFALCKAAAYCKSKR